VARIAVRWLVPGLVLASATFVLIYASGLMAGRAFSLGAFSSIQFVLTTNAAALASTLGILMALVLLMVQLTAQRYSFSIIGMFVNNPVNIALVVLFIITISFNLWLGSTIDEDHIPQVGVYLALSMGTLCFGLLIPYFGYLFDNLTPQSLLNALQRDALAAVRSARQGRAIHRARDMAHEKVQQTGDITRTSVGLSDADVATHSIWALYGTLCEYLECKPHLPSGWFRVEDRFFRERHALVLQEIEASGTWFERHLLEEYQAAFSNSLNRLEPVNTAVALCCRMAAERALEHRDEAALRLLIKFFNTFLRAALNAHDQRAGYHLLYQYALLANAALHSRPDIALEIAHRIAYYGDAAVGMNVFWMAVAAAQDLRTLAEASSREGLPHETTARIHGELIELVRGSEVKKAPVTGMLQKAIIGLGGFLLDRGEEALAHDLAQSLRHVDAGTLSRLAADLQMVTEPQFWELTERVVNFEYVEDGARARLGEFLAMATAGQARVDGPRVTRVSS
jgi:hypothetical protein